ncbi:alpha/beta fold hydrolase [Paenibacillus thiaminolyticus]|uniref:alpha/beta fold hydrolase n=1 Tax=Paenibacillus thiaminolyticus TaxID=49283 RepID=UPI002543A9A9|nr:alpha/beta hydrolase [Paenibacillus thiaminolyticus]WII38661.1 alpha/beta hydrolase [Paenibacillus thiaminolyticus]
MPTIAVHPQFSMRIEEQGQGPAVVLLHGFCGSSGYWAELAPLLAGSCRVITPDLRGHGTSDAPVGPYTIEQMADDVLHLADTLGLDQFVLLGHSLGGYITLSFAQRHAHRLKGFGLIHSTGKPDTEEGKQKRLATVEALQRHGIVPVVDDLVPKLFAEDSGPGEAIDKAKEIGYSTPPQGAIGAALAMRERPDRTAVLQAATLPVLLVAGEKDRIVAPENVFTAAGDHIEHVTLEGVGHMGMMEAPQKLAAAIRSFMDTAYA